MNIILVKPHPPSEILEKRCPIQENYKYNWEPIALKLMAQKLKHHHEDIKVEIWHLMNHQDDEKFLSAVEQNKPQLVAFSEIDILVNEVNHLSQIIRKKSPSTKIIVGGKHSSLLRKGDKSPFLYADYAIRGDGVNAINQFVECFTDPESELTNIDGIVAWDENQKIFTEDTFSTRGCEHVDNIELHKIEVQNHNLDQYVNEYQIQASIAHGKVVTSPIYTGQGCPFNCHFCQSPMELGKVGKVVQMLPEKVAAEINWLLKNYSVNNFFSLEPNVDLKNLLSIYDELEKYEIDSVAISGFIRPADVVKANHSGLLKKLVKKGMRILYIGLDVPLDIKKDVFNKKFSYEEMMECVRICKDNGIIVISTMLGDPSLSKEELRTVLENASMIPVSEIEVRLAIALRNTKFYEACGEFLIHNPDHDFTYFDQQNYRYQTLQYPDKIKPEETYELVNNFNKEFYFTDGHLAYVRDMITNHPDTIPYFKRLYESKVMNHPEMEHKIGWLFEQEKRGEKYA